MATDALEPSSSPAPMIDHDEPLCDASIVTFVPAVTPVKLNVTVSLPQDTEPKVAADAEDAANAMAVTAKVNSFFIIVPLFETYLKVG